jgi:hypothetical protein
MHPNQRSCQLWLETVLGDFNVKVEKESYLYTECGGHSLHNKLNFGRIWVVIFSLGRDLAVMGK